VKILQVSSASSFGGGERYLADLANSLTDRGHQIFAALRPKSALLSHLKLSEQNIKTLPLRNAFDVPSARALSRFVEQNQIDVVHAHMARDYSLAAYASRRQRAKLVVTRHVLFPLSSLHRRTLAGATRVIAVSSAVARSLESQNLVRNDQIAVVPNGINVDRFDKALSDFDRERFLASKGFPTDTLLVGSIGELRTLKRHDDFIKAAVLVSRRFSNVQFFLAGVDSAGGEVERQLRQLATQSGLDGRFHFLGWVDDAEQLLCALDVFVSASETESFGLAIAEAMSTETAVVASATEGAQEVIENQRTGVIVPIGDVEQMEQAISSLLENSAQRSEMGVRARAAVKERFSLRRMVDDIEKIYLI
jgi:L-malate glycosyltransferase